MNKVGIFAAFLASVLLVMGCTSSDSKGSKSPTKTNSNTGDAKNQGGSSKPSEGS